MEIRLYKEGDEREILELFNICFGREMSLEYWKWRFIDNPNAISPMIYLMWDDDKLAGHYAVSQNILDFKGNKLLAALSMTTMTHPTYGGRGVFTKLASELYRNEQERNKLDVVWGFPNNNSHRSFNKNLNWEDIGIVPVFSLNLEIFRFAEKQDLYCQVESFKESHVKAYEKSIAKYDISLVKSLDYFNWRYSKNPENNYVIFENRDDGSFLVTKLFGNEVDIVEWSVPNEFIKAKAAVNKITEYYKQIGINKINLWMPLNDDRHLDLEKLGFANVAPVTYLGCRNLKSNDKYGPLNWCFQMGDSDVY